jgi:hypothetical protein
MPEMNLVTPMVGSWSWSLRYRCTGNGHGEYRQRARNESDQPSHEAPLCEG